MITEKQKCMAEQAVYGNLQVVDRDDELWIYAGLGLSELVEGDCALYDKDDNVQYDWTDEIKPILRPMSDLTKEITHKGYTGDNPFISLVELAKIAYSELGEEFIFENTDKEELLSNPKTNGVYQLSGFTLSNNIFKIYEWGEVIKRNKFDTDPFVEIINRELNQQQLYDLLHQLHFDTRNLIANNEAIDVNTLPNNPYEI